MTSTDRGSNEHRHRYSDAELHNPDVAHEEADINIRTVLMFAGGLAVIVLISALLMGLLFRVFSSQAAANDPQVSPLALPSGQSPPAPNLLTDEPAVLRKFEAEEAKQLGGYGWVDQQAGVVRLPIEEAKKLIVQRGLPVRATGAVDDASVGSHAPAYGEASGGRTIPVQKSPPPPQPPAAGESNTDRDKRPATSKGKDQ
jgi:hypothetical protein